MRRKFASLSKPELSRQLHLVLKKTPRIDVVSDLLKAGADPNARDECEWTPLFDAVINEKLKIARLLVAHKADVNAADKYGWTPLLAYMDANVGYYRPGMISFLLENGAKVSQKTLRFSYESPTNLGATLHEGGVTNALMYCRFIGIGLDNDEIRSFRRLAKMLLRAEDAFEDLQTCAKLAAEAGDMEILQKAFEAGADISGLLPYALIFKNSRIVRYLMENHAFPDAKNEDDMSALFIATMRSPYWVRKMLAYGADPNVENSGETALDVARENEHDDCAKILIEHGAVGKTTGADDKKPFRDDFN